MRERARTQRRSGFAGHEVPKQRLEGMVSLFLLLGFPLALFSPMDCNLGVDLFHRDLVQACPPRIFVAFLELIRWRRHHPDVVGDAQDQNRRLTISLHKETLAVLHGAGYDLVKFGAGGFNGEFCGRYRLPRQRFQPRYPREVLIASDQRQLMFPRNRGDPEVVFGDSRANLLQIGLDVAVMLRREFIGRQDGAECAETRETASRSWPGVRT